MSDPTDIKLVDGRVIVLRELRQSLTYEGLLEGVPTPEMNAHHVRGVVERERKNAAGAAVYLIEPIETPLEPAHDPRRKRASIPRITCVARYLSFQPARERLDGSELVVVWFQNAFGPPAGGQALEQIQQIPWSKVAHDFEF